MNKVEKRNLIIGRVAIVWSILVFIFLFIFFIRPFDNAIVEGRPILTKLCEMQLECDVVGGHLKCGYSDNTPKHYQVNASRGLVNHPWYKGCNESTPGYSVGSGGIKYVSGIKVCNCGGLN